MKQLHINSITVIIYQITIIFIGLVLPKITLITYGSIINGLVASITQMLGVISLLELGIGIIVQTSLYKPLAEKDFPSVSLIYYAAQKYFRGIAGVLLIYIACLCIYFGLFHSEVYSWIFTTTLIISISISSFAQYYFGICNTLLLNADQKVYINTLINYITIVLNAIITIFMMLSGCSIHLVKLVSSLIFILRPLLIYLYVKKHYRIFEAKNVSLSVLKDKYSGMVQHISSVLSGSVDYMVLTVLSTFEAVSIYSIYVLPLNCIRNLIIMVSTGYKSFLGNIIVTKTKAELLSEFNKYELYSHYFTTLLFGCASLVIVPFIKIYTQDVTDANYIDTTFAVLITMSYYIYSLQIPYISLIFSAGHFKQTQWFCVGECAINIATSFFLVNYIGIIGVAIGTVLSVSYRLVLSVFYLKRNIISREIKRFILLLFADASCIIIINLSSFFSFACENYLEWIFHSCIILLYTFLITTLVYKVFFLEDFSLYPLRKHLNI